MNEPIFTMNAKLRLAALGLTWEELAKQANEDPGNVRGWVRRGNPRGDTMKRLARLLGIPEWELLNPEFNPRGYPAPDFNDGGNEDETDSHQLDGFHGKTL